jgi:hypothetical protein
MTRHLMFLAAWALLGGLTPASAALLSVDINDRTEGEAANPVVNTASGFSPYTISSGTNSTGVVNGYTVNFDVFDDGNPNDGGAAGNQAGAFDDRDRDTPNGTPTHNQLYDDLIFVGNSAGPTGGVDLTISGGALLPSRSYLVSIYAYDGISEAGGGASATPVRSANWFDGNNLDALVFNTTFATNVRPATDDAYKFTGVAMTDGAGKLFLKGRRVSSGDVSVYVNGFVVSGIPEPASLALAGACLPLAALATRRRRK